MVELSSLDVLFLARELRVLEDAYLDRVYELGPGEFLLRTRHPERGRGALILKPGSYATLAEEPPETPQSPTSFATLLRKHLPNARIRRIEQQGFDRVLVFHLEERGEPFRLVVELFGKGNLLVVGGDGKIRVVQRTETFRDRTLKVGETFQFPPSRVNPVHLTRTEFGERCDKSDRDAVRFLAMEVGFGPDLSEELLHRSKVTKTRKVNELTESDRDAIWKEWQAILHANAQPTVAVKGTSARVEAIPMGGPKYSEWSRSSAPTLSAAILEANERNQAERPPERDEERERLERQIQTQLDAIGAMEQEAAGWAASANTLYENFEESRLLHAAAAKFIEENDWSKAEALWKAGQAPAGIVQVLPQARRVVLRVGDKDYKFDPKISLDKNASLFFDEAKRIRAKAESARQAVAAAQATLAVHEKSAQRAAAVKPRVKAPDKRFWFEGFRWFYTTEGFLVVGGRDAASNEKVVKKHLHAGDLYFHADIHGAPSCVLKTEGRPPGEASIRQAAQFAAAYSKAFAQFGSADAYYVNPEQVSKTAASGEFVPRGAFIVRGERTYVPKLPMELALGPVTLDKQGAPAADGGFRRLMGGPTEAVRALSKNPILVARGDRKPTEVVREVATRFSVSHEEVQAVLPPGTLRIAEPGGPT
jgi:predicted ribosome quality control (RQC) complex YloA/Tae2 family protein